MNFYRNPEEEMTRERRKQPEKLMLEVKRGKYKASSKQPSIRKCGLISWENLC